MGHSRNIDILSSSTYGTPAIVSAPELQSVLQPSSCSSSHSTQKLAEGPTSYATALPRKGVDGTEVDVLEAAELPETSSRNPGATSSSCQDLVTTSSELEIEQLDEDVRTTAAPSATNTDVPHSLTSGTTKLSNAKGSTGQASSSSRAPGKVAAEVQNEQTSTLIPRSTPVQSPQAPDHQPTAPPPKAEEKKDSDSLPVSSSPIKQSPSTSFGSRSGSKNKEFLKAELKTMKIVFQPASLPSPP